jgi:hypothetical protein
MDGTSVVHVNDCASTAAQLIGEAARRGMHWDLLPLATPDPPLAGPAGLVRKGALGARWLARLALEARSHDLVHVHSAGVLRHARWATRRYVLHCHGTDVRSQQYDPRWSGPIRSGLMMAEAVFYSTPDLAEHVRQHRPDALYLPVPIDTAQLPDWAPRPGRPLVLFASRWGPDKGGGEQLDVAEALVHAVGERADVAGLDWGPLAADAGRRGVALLPRTDRGGFLRLLASAHVVVGQSAGILAASELEALGTGAPVVMPVDLPLYSGTGLPVLGGRGVGAVVDAVDRLLSEPAVHDPAAGRAFVERVHGVSGALDRVLDTYDEVLVRRSA